jgi:hypothetical protein
MPHLFSSASLELSLPHPSMLDFEFEIAVSDVHTGHTVAR